MCAVGMGFFCDAYDLFSISLVQKTIGRIYYPDPTYQCTPAASAVASAASVGGINCYKILEQVGIVGSDKQFLSNYDSTGNGWGPANGYISNPNPELYDRISSFVPGAIPNNTANAITAIALVGTIVGQLLFGYLGDVLGRRRIFSITLYILIISAAAQAFSFGSSATAVISSLLFFRFMLGVGVGGDYPLAATLMSEYSGRNNRGAFVAAVFAMQGIGYLAAAIFALIMSSIFDATRATSNPDHLWRIILAFGAVPASCVLYARLNMPETPRYTAFISENASQLVEDMNYVMAADASRIRGTAAVAERPSSLQFGTVNRREVNAKRIDYRQFFKAYGVVLFGCAASWFLVDVAFYSQNLTQGTVFSTIGWLPSAYTMTTTEEAFHVARAQAIISLSSTVPGYWFTVFTIERMGRWRIQMMGFFFMTLFMGILAGDYTNLTTYHTSAFVAIYALTFFFANWGPNATTFVVPAEVFPTQYRTTGHGISAAGGKLGATLGAFGFNYMSQNVSLQAALGLLTGISFLGMLSTLLIPDVTGKTLEEVSTDKIESRTVTDSDASKDATEMSVSASIEAQAVTGKGDEQAEAKDDKAV